MVKVSVVIPTHNREDLLPRAINSVISQKMQDFEVIVVSDGSTDDTEVVVKKIQGRDNRVRFEHYHPSKGGNFARNEGIRLSKGEYVAFLDDDDEWLPSKLDKQLSLMEQNPKMVLCYTGVHVIYVNEKIEYSFLPKYEGDLSRVILLDNCIGSTSTPMIRKSVFEKSGVFDNDLSALQDFDLWIRITQCGEIGAVKEELINYYNYRGTKQVSAITAKYEHAFAYINKKYKNLFDKLSETDKKTKLINEYILLGNKSMRNNEKKKAREYYKKVLGTNFSIKNLVFYVLSYTSYDFILRLRNLV